MAYINILADLPQRLFLRTTLPSEDRTLGRIHNVLSRENCHILLGRGSATHTPYISYARIMYVRARVYFPFFPLSPLFSRGARRRRCCVRASRPFPRAVFIHDTYLINGCSTGSGGASAVIRPEARRVEVRRRAVRRVRRRAVKSQKPL